MKDEDDAAPADTDSPRRVRETQEPPKIEAGFLHSFRRGGELVIPVAAIHELRLRHIEHAQPPTSYWAVFANDRLIHAHDDHDPVRAVFDEIFDAMSGP